MLSRIDIIRELSKNINIYPFKKENLKENSINLSASFCAWTTISGDVFIDEKGNFKPYNSHKSQDYQKIHFSKGMSAVREINGESLIILLPLSTTLIETEEVISISNKIGGTYHSKVGIASQGTGHIGTMLGPNFSGHSLIAVHNVSKYPLTIKVGDTFVSVTFNYLKTPLKHHSNSNLNAHIDKLTSYGIKLTKKESNFLNEDWKRDILKVKNKMLNKSLKRDIKDLKRENLRTYNLDKLKRLSSFISPILLVCILLIIIDKIYGTQITPWLLNVGLSGIIVSIVMVLNT